MHLDEIVKKIVQLSTALQKSGASTDEVASRINDILLIVDKVPKETISMAWDVFANRKGSDI